MILVICARKVARILALTVLVITLASFTVALLQYIWDNQDFPAPWLFNVARENNIPTWYSSFQLLLCSILLATIAAFTVRRGHRYASHWAVLSAVFLLLSLDEVASLHERLSHGPIASLARNLPGLGAIGFFSRFWVVPATIFTIIFVLAYLRFLVALPRETRRLFILAGAVFVLGALGMEMLSARVVSSYGIEDWGNVSGYPKMLVILQTVVEELFEMLGIVVFIYALLAYIGSHAKEITVRVRVGNDDR